MPTGDRRIEIYPKRLLSLTGVDTQFLKYLIGEIDEVMAAIFSGAEGTLDTDTVGITSSANDVFTLDYSSASKGVTGNGKLIDLSLVNGTDITSAIPFENTNTIPYYVGIRHQEVPYQKVEENPLTLDAEYPSQKQTYGEQGAPTSVTDNTTYIRIILNTITESGVDHSGRKVKVWLADPVSVVDSVAFHEGTIAYSAPNNYVDISYSGADGPLGQDTSSGPPSTTASDYVVFIEGATWRRNTDLRTDPTNYWFIGIITGNGPAATPVAFDLSDQNPALLISLDRAYDGIAGSGSGRQVTVDSGAVLLKVPGTGGSGDDHKAALRVERIGDAVTAGICVEAIADENNGASIAGLQALISGTDLETEESVTQAGSDLLNFTRGAVDLVTAGVARETDLVWITNISGHNGLYTIDARNSLTQLKLLNLDGSAISSWDTLSGNATILRPQIWSAHPSFSSASSPKADALKGTAFARTPVRIFPFGSTAVQLYSSTDPPAVRSSFSSNALFNGYGALLNPDADEKLVVDPTNIPARIGKMVEFKGHVDGAGRVWEFCGREGRPHHFSDDFNYVPAAWTSSNPSLPAALDLKYTTAFLGALSDIFMTTANQDANHGGVVELKSGVSSGNYAALRAVDGLWVLKNNPVIIFFRFAVASTADRIDYLRFRSNSTSHMIGFYRSTGGAGGNNWRAFTDDGTTLRESSDLFSPTADTFYNFIMVVTSDTGVYFHTSGSGGTPTALVSFDHTGLAANVGFRLEAHVETSDGSTKSGYLDYWEIEDATLMYSGAYA